MRLLESGHIHRLRQYWIPQRIKCVNTKIKIGVDIEDIAPLLIFLVLTYNTVLFLLIIELLSYRILGRKNI